MKRRSFLAMLGFAPLAAAVAAETEAQAVGDVTPPFEFRTGRAYLRNSGDWHRVSMTAGRPGAVRGNLVETSPGISNFEVSADQFVILPDVPLFDPRA